MHTELILDSGIRDWVLLPLLYFMIVLTYFRTHVMKLFSTSNIVPDLKQLREGQILVRAARLRTNGDNIPPEAFRARRQYFCKEAFELPPKDPNPLNQMMQNPNQSTANMFDMMKRNLANVIIQPLVMMWVSYFFAGFVVGRVVFLRHRECLFRFTNVIVPETCAAKIPFPLPLRFRAITQLGIEQLADLDVTYVSSLSWYFLVLFGMMGVTSLLLGSGNEMEMMIAPGMQNMMTPGAGGAPDAHTLFPAEKSNLEIHKHQWVVGDSETRLREKSTELSLL